MAKQVLGHCLRRTHLFFSINMVIICERYCIIVVRFAMVLVRDL